MSVPPPTAVAFALRTECPPGACVCDRDAMLQDPSADLRVLRLTRAEEKQLIARLEQVTSLGQLRQLQERMQSQLGISLTLRPGANEVRTLRGITILVHEQRGLCRKTRQALPAAIRRSLEDHPEISYELLNEGGLFGP